MKHNIDVQNARNTCVIVLLFNFPYKIKDKWIPYVIFWWHKGPGGGGGCTCAIVRNKMCTVCVFLLKIEIEP